MTATARVKRAIHVMLVAGESSGDVLGAGLIRALRELSPRKMRFSGVGGPAMEGAGLSSLFPMRELSLMGLTEVLPKVPELRRRLRETEAHALVSRPDVVVTIDSPGFNLRLARRLRKHEAPVVQYVAPQIWAWRPRRAEKMAAIVDHVLALLPFEPPLFKAAGLPCTFVGHPVLESGADKGNGGAFRIRHGIPDTAKLLAVLPGSRESETTRLLDPFGETVRQLAAVEPSLQVVVPTMEPLVKQVEAATKMWNVPVMLLRGGVEKFDAFAASDAALAASGTVALELAMARVSMVTAYRMHPVTWQVMRRIVRSPYVNLINVISDRSVVPELLQASCAPDWLVPEVINIFRNEGARAKQMEAAETAIAAIAPPGGSPSNAAAMAVLRVLEAGRSF